VRGLSALSTMTHQELVSLCEKLYDESGVKGTITAIVLRTALKQVPRAARNCLVTVLPSVVNVHGSLVDELATLRMAAETVREQGALLATLLASFGQLSRDFELRLQAARTAAEDALVEAAHALVVAKDGTPAPNRVVVALPAVCNFDSEAGAQSAIGELKTTVTSAIEKMVDGAYVTPATREVQAMAQRLLDTARQSVAALLDAPEFRRLNIQERVFDKPAIDSSAAGE
jgi:hypothetical protein